jgi:hypothetical protein
MEKLIKTNRGFFAQVALEHTSGKSLTIKNIVSKFGSNYGLMKLIRYASFLYSLDTVNQNYIGLKTTGLNLIQKNILIFQNANILFTMGLISIKRDVLSI